METDLVVKPETRFRRGKVIPFLLKLKNTAYFPIQQLAIIGDADFILCSWGHFVWLELKRSAKEKPEPLQARKAQWVQTCGGVAVVASPDNWETVANWLRHLDETGEKLANY